MSIFSRLFKIGQAKVNQTVDNLENPEVMLDQAIRDKEKDIEELRQSVASCIASEKKTLGMLNSEKSEQKNWETKAETALKSGREDLAVKALSRAQEHENNAATLQTNWENQKNDVENLKRDLQKEMERLEEYKRNRNFIIAQSKFADAKKSIHEARAKIGSKRSSADSLMERMREKAQNASYEADAIAELANEDTSVDKAIEELEETQGSAEVQDKLAALKAKLGQGQTQN